MLPFEWSRRQGSGAGCCRRDDVARPGQDDRNTLRRRRSGAMCRTRRARIVRTLACRISAARLADRKGRIGKRDRRHDRERRQQRLQRDRIGRDQGGASVQGSAAHGARIAASARQRPRGNSCLCVIFSRTGFHFSGSRTRRMAHLHGEASAAAPCNDRHRAPS